MLLLADIDAFFASVEQLTKPDLAGRPVIVGTGVVASCSYEARPRGVEAGMPIREARRRCPEAVVLDGKEKVYASFAERIFAICRDVAPAVETYLDEAYLDLEGAEGYWGSAREAARVLRERVRDGTGLVVSVGIARNRLFAKLAAQRAKPDGVASIRGETEERRVLRDLPVRRLPGIGPVYARRLAELNVRTAGRMQELPESTLVALFGERGRALHRRCRGEDTRPVVAREVPRSISRSTTFHRPTDDRREIDGMVHYLVERAARAARELGVAPRTVEVRIRWDDGKKRSGRRTLPRPCGLDDELVEEARAILGRIDDRRVNLRHLGIALSRFALADGGTQIGLFEGKDRPRRRRLQETIDRIRADHGHASLVRGRSIDLLDRLEQDRHGFRLRTPSLTK